MDSKVKLTSAYSSTAKRENHFLLTHDEVETIVVEWAREQVGKETAVVTLSFDHFYDRHTLLGPRAAK